MENNITKQSNKFSLNQLLNSENVKKRTTEILGDRSAQFLASILQVTKDNNYLSKADPNSVLQAEMVAATLDLPINNNLGFAYIVPYKNDAQFQMGWKGFVQLALRSGQYKKINVIEIKEGEINELKLDPLREDYMFNWIQDPSKREAAKTVGYAAFFQLVNGFEKTVYWTKEAVTQHAKKFSKSFGYSTSAWQTNFDAMAKKTVLKNMLANYGSLSVDYQMQKAIKFDQSVVKDFKVEEVEYPDNPNGNPIEEVKGTIVGDQKKETEKDPRALFSQK